MRSGTEMEFSFSNSVEQTVFFQKENTESKSKNLDLVEKIIGQLGQGIGNYLTVLPSGQMSVQM